MESDAFDYEREALVIDRMFYFTMGMSCGFICTTIIGCLIFLYI